MDSMPWIEARLGHPLNRSGWFMLILSKLILKSKVPGFPLLLFFSMLTIGSSLTNHVALPSLAVGFNMPFSAMCDTCEKLATD